MREKLLTNALGVFFVFFVFTENSNAQNLLDTSTWTLGSGSVTGFSKNGDDSENIRELGISPNGNSVILWKAVPDADGGASGGFNTDFLSIDHTKAYRFTIWVKKTNSTNGLSYLGCNYNGQNNIQNSVVNLSGSPVSDPYFWAGKFDELNKWYLVVGYVHGSNYNSSINYGGIYDGATGEKVESLNDFKFKSTATTTRLRTYLNWDSNTSDRQYFYAPRMELVDGNEPSVEELLGLSEFDGNLLNTSTWTVGCGPVSGFSQNGTTSENCRELGKNHVGEEVVLWKGGNDASSNADGGWNTGWHDADHDISYRFSVWLKKTNSNDGHSYLGFYANGNGSLRLNGTYNSNPYFWFGDLPKLNRWYLVVGYVHKSSHTGTTNLGRIYDGVTGEEVRTITDYKFKNTVTQIRHRSYLYYDTNTADRQYFWAPRIDRIDGNEPTITELLHVNENSKLIFSFDTAGNQKQLFYCGDPTFCAPPSARKPQQEDVVASKSEEETHEDENVNEETVLDDFLQVFPNPTKGYITLRLEDTLLESIHSIKLYNTNSVLIKSIQAKNNITQIDLSNIASGVYFIHIHVNKGKSITKKIIKN